MERIAATDKAFTDMMKLPPDDRVVVIYDTKDGTLIKSSWANPDTPLSQLVKIMTETLETGRK